MVACFGCGFILMEIGFEAGIHVIGAGLIPGAIQIYWEIHGED